MVKSSKADTKFISVHENQVIVFIDNTFFLYDIMSEKEVGVIEPVPQFEIFCCLSITYNNELNIIYAGEKGLLFVFQKSKKIFNKLNGSKDDTYCITEIKYKNTPGFATLSRNGELRIFDLVDKLCVGNIVTGFSVSSLCYMHLQYDVILISNFDGTIHCYNIQTNQLIDKVQKKKKIGLVLESLVYKNQAF